MKPLHLWKFAAADVAATPAKGNRTPAVFYSFTIDHDRGGPGAKSRQLKPCFNKSGESWFSARKTRRARADRVKPIKALVMALVTTASLPSPAASQHGQRAPLAEIRTFLGQFVARAFDTYRPELHYMRGPGPACRAKQMALSPAVQSMLADIRAAKAQKSPTSRS